MHYDARFAHSFSSRLLFILSALILSFALSRARALARASFIGDPIGAALFSGIMIIIMWTINKSLVRLCTLRSGMSGMGIKFGKPSRRTGTFGRLFANSRAQNERDSGPGDDRHNCNNG